MPGGAGVLADTAREEADEFVEKAEVIIAAMENADVSTLGELFEGRGKGAGERHGIACGRVGTRPPTS